MSNTGQCPRCGGGCPATGCQQDGETAAETVIETEWGTTIRVSGDAKVITGRVQHFTATPGGDWRLAGSAREDVPPVLAAARRMRDQCCPMDTYGTDATGSLRPECSCLDGCECLCAGCICRTIGDGGE